MTIRHILVIKKIHESFTVLPVVPKDTNGFLKWEISAIHNFDGKSNLDEWGVTAVSVQTYLWENNKMYNLFKILLRSFSWYAINCLIDIGDLWQTCVNNSILESSTVLGKSYKYVLIWKYMVAETRAASRLKASCTVPTSWVNECLTRGLNSDITIFFDSN